MGSQFENAVFAQTIKLIVRTQDLEVLRVPALEVSRAIRAEAVE